MEKIQDLMRNMDEANEKLRLQILALKDERKKYYEIEKEKIRAQIQVSINRHQETMSVKH